MRGREDREEARLLRFSGDLATWTPSPTQGSVTTSPDTAWSMAQFHELLNPQLLRAGLGALVVAYAIKVFINYRNAIASFNHTPGYRGFLSHRSNITRLLPHWKYFSGGEIFEYWNKYERMSLIHCDLEYLLTTGQTYRV